MSEERVIDAEKIVIRDKAGRVRIEMSCDPDGSAGIRLLDTEGRRVCVLGVDGLMTPVLVMLDPRGVPRVKIGAFHGGTPVIELLDENNVGRVVLTCYEGNPFMQLLDERTKPFWTAP